VQAAGPSSSPLRGEEEETTMRCAPVRTGDAPCIPRRIVQFWHHPAPPGDVCAKMRSWRGANPEFEHIVFHDRTAAAYLNEKHGAGARRAFERMRDPVQRADLFRLAYLACEGGFYADVDTLCLADIATFVPTNCTFVAAQEEHGALSNTFVGVASGHPVIA